MTKSSAAEELSTLLALHTRALCCHCECQGMNAANMHAVMLDYSAPYNDEHYLQIMAKWGLVDETGKPTFI